MKSHLQQLFFCLVLAFLAGTNFLWAQEVKGRVLDAATNEPMPGVAIQYNQSLNQGTVSDNNGYFTIPTIRKVQTVVLSFIGYKTASFGHEVLPRNGNVWIVKLEEETAQLQEVEVIAGENPALRMVRNAISNRNNNNPRKYSSYQYVSYNKNVITYRMDLPDTTMSRQDSLQFQEDTIKAQNRHMMVIESVTKKYYKEPNKAKEIIIGTKISGFKHPGVAATPDGIQNFGFQENIIPLVNKKFLNPIADGADKHYVYILKDTLYDGSDSIFVMDYWPEKGANFEGFKGEMSISTRKWAIVHVTAYPYDVGKINIYLEQYYKWIGNGFWFPVQMNFELELEKVPFKNTGAVMIGKTTLDSVRVGLPIDDAIFNHLEVELKEEAAYVDEEFWDEYRNEELSAKEVETFRQMDSIGNRYKFDALLNSTRNIYDGFIVIKKVDVEYSKILAANAYEGWRFGLGLYTNDKLWKKLRVGGYFGYGTNDKQWKYGGKLIYYFSKPNDFYFTISHLKDVRDPGGIRLRYAEWSNVAQQFFNKLMDKVEETEVSMTFRAGLYQKFKIGVRQFSLQPTYSYLFLGTDNPDQVGSSIYRFSEVQVNYRWQHKEKFASNWGQRISSGSKWPVVNMIYSRGIDGVFDSDFSYNKLELGILYTRYTRNLGKTRIQLDLGMIDKSLPWSMNFSGRPSYNPSFSVVVKETFQTMRFNEFSSDKYFALFFMHDFGPLLLRFEHFKPEFRLFQGITYGSLSNPQLQEGLPLKTLENGFFESGLVLDNILRFNMFNTGYLGIGGGAFYRYGPNQLPGQIDNWAFKVAFMYSVN